MILRPPISTLFPFTTLFRSRLRTAPSLAAGNAGDSRPSRKAAAPSAPPTASPRTRVDAVGGADGAAALRDRSEEHTSELQSRPPLVCRLLLEQTKSH